MSKILKDGFHDMNGCLSHFSFEPVQEKTFADCTTHFANVRKVSPHYVPISICGKTPEGWNPVKWAGEVGIREVARLCCRSEEVLLLRCSNPPSFNGPAECPWSGFASILFGSAFSLKDERWCSVSGDWIVIGSESAVRHYLQRSVRAARKDWNMKMTKAAVLADDIIVDCRESGIQMEVYKTY